MFLSNCNVKYTHLAVYNNIVDVNFLGTQETHLIESKL